MKRNTWQFVKLTLSLGFASLIIALALALCIYPAFVVARLLFDAELKATGHPQALPEWFENSSDPSHPPSASVPQTRWADWITRCR